MAVVSLDNFIKAAPLGAERVLVALAEAESLTDSVAAEIYELSPIEGVSARLFIKALHYSSFVAPRNSEWHIAPEVRTAIRDTLVGDASLKLAANKLLLQISRTGDRNLARTELPGYLFTPAGRAFHLAATGNPDAALAEYSNSAMGPLRGEQWLADRLAEEQERTGAIPRGSLEVVFLRAMVLYRSDRRAEAQPLFRSLAQSQERRVEVAVACHLLGNMISRRSPREAEDLYRRAISILESIGDQQGVAKPLHSLANLLSRDRARVVEAEELYRRAIAIEEGGGNQHGVAQTLHSLANLLSRDRARTAEAEELYERSISIGENTGNQNHIAQTLHSLANLLSRDRARAVEAEDLYRRAIAIEERSGYQRGVAQTLHSLANLLSRDRGRATEAENLYERSISIGEKTGNQNHIAQTLRSLANLVEQRSAKEAEQLLNRSLEINSKINNRQGASLVRDSLKQLRRRHQDLN